MAIYWLYLIAAGLSVAISLVATPVVKYAGTHYGRVDIPSARKVHHQPMVRLGGVAIFCATVLTTVWLLSNGQWLNSPVLELSAADISKAGLLLLGGSGFFVVGLADDLFELAAFHRLWMQVGIASYLWWCGLRVDGVVLPWVDSSFMNGLSLPITVLWLAGVVNAINWMDGLDGLAGGISSISLGCLLLLHVEEESGNVHSVATPVMSGLIAAAVLGSLLGFLYYNAHPAKIFMGDGGSYFVGFMLASLCIVESEGIESSVTSAFPLIVLLVPLADMLSVIATRLYQRKSPFEADNRHLHHRLLSMGFSHRETVWVIYGLAMTSGCLAMATAKPNGWGWIAAVAIFLLLLSAVITRQLWQTKNGDGSKNSAAIDTITGTEIW